jgi:hypothetical protein
MENKIMRLELQKIKPPSRTSGSDMTTDFTNNPQSIGRSGMRMPEPLSISNVSLTKMSSGIEIQTERYSIKRGDNNFAESLAEQRKQELAEAGEMMK